MSSKFVTVAVATGVLLIASCKWFSTAPKENAFNIEGKWTIDSIAAGKDSSLGNALLAMAVFQKDSIRRGIEFLPDSTYTEIPESQSGKGKYYVKEKELYLFEDSTLTRYSINVVTDSVLNLFEKDSSLIVLKRQ